PVPAGRTAHEAVRRVSDWFRLRDCPQSQEMNFAGDGDLFPVVRAAGCLRHALGTCLGPCAAACTRSAYLGQVQAVRAFLAGRDTTPLEVLQRDMQEASERMQFERAGVLRDKLAGLRWLHGWCERLRAARELSFVYPVRGHAGKDLWYLIAHGRVAAVVPWPQDAAGQARADAARARVYQGEKARSRLLAVEEVEGVLLVAGRVPRHPAARARTLR